MGKNKFKHASFLILFILVCGIPVFLSACAAPCKEPPPGFKYLSKEQAKELGECYR